MGRTLGHSEHAAGSGCTSLIRDVFKSANPGDIPVVVDGATENHALGVNTPLGLCR